MSGRLIIATAGYLKDNHGIVLVDRGDGRIFVRFPYLCRKMYFWDKVKRFFLFSDWPKVECWLGPNEYKPLEVNKEKENVAA